MEQAYVQQPQFVVMPVSNRNGLGVFGFLIALIGLFIPTGLVAILGLMLSLAAIGRAPRGFATAGVVFGLIGTVIWGIVMLASLVVALVAALGALVFVAAGFVMTQPHVVETTGDMINVAIAVEEYRQENDEIPADVDGLSLRLASTIDPWGTAYRVVHADADPGFDVVSSGPDQAFETDDDIRLSSLDRLWEDAFDSFDDRMEEFGKRMERIEGFSFECSGMPCIEVEDYEKRARNAIEAAIPAPAPKPAPACPAAPRAPHGPGGPVVAIGDA